MAALLLQQRSRKYLNLEDKLSRKYLIESTKMEQKDLHEGHGILLVHTTKK